MTEARTEGAWLIEMPQTHPDYGGWPTWLAGVDGCEPVWTTEHMRAVRFSRKIDAERLASGLIPEGLYFVSDHMWIPAELCG